MAAFVSGSRFGWKVGLRLAIFAALIGGFPFIVFGLLLATNARSVAGASGALAVVAAIYLKPIIIVGFAVSMLAPCWQRMRSLDLPPYLGLVIPALFLFDWPFFMVFGSHWGAAFALGIARFGPPLYALTAVVLLLMLTFAAPRSDQDPPGAQRFGAAGVLGAVLAVAVVGLALISTAMGSMAMVQVMAQSPKQAVLVMRGMGPALHVIFVLKPYLCFFLCVIAGWLAYRSHRGGEIDGLSPPSALKPSSPVAPSSSMPTAGRVVFGRR